MSVSHLHVHRVPSLGWRFVAFTAIFLLASTGAPPAGAESAKLEPEQFRDVMSTLAVFLEEAAGRHEGTGDLEAKIRDLSPEELQALAAAFPDHEALLESVRLIGSSFFREGGPEPAPWKVITGTNTPAFPPPYPTGSVYETFVLIPQAVGALSDSNGDGKVNDERCTANYEAGLMIALAIEKTASVVAQVLCDTLVVILGEGTNAPACVAAGIANEVLALTELAQDQCSLQDALVDSAEIEAAYENSKILVDALTCRTVGQLRKSHGCDGEDEDCDLVVDECDEDVFAPDLHLDGSVGAPWFESFAEAAAAVAGSVDAVDDCQRVTVGSPSLAGLCANVVATVDADDACGNRSTASAVVKVDGTPPTVVVGTAEDACFTTVAEAEGSVLASTSIADDCTAAGDLDVRVRSTVTECSLRVRTDATDLAGHTTSGAVTVRVDDEQPSVAIERLLLGFRGAPLGFQTPACYDTVADAEAAVFAATRFADNCTATERLETSVASSGDACQLLVTSRSVDECGNANTDAVTVRVDRVAPRVSCSVVEEVLSPANHKMIDVGFAFSATDNCLDEPEVTLGVTSDEPTASAAGAGQSSPSPDAEILTDPAGDVRIRLRAERASAGDGRVYEIRVVARDACGNVGQATCRVSVPPNGGAAAVDSGQLYDATAVN